MPCGPFPDYQSCTLHFAQDPDVDDPEEMCRYIEERSKEDDIMDGDKIIYGLDVQYMSLVDNPAVGDSVWLKSKKLKLKDRNDRQMKSKALHAGTGRGYFIKSELDDDNYVVKAVALIPDKVDGNGEALSEAEIYKAMLKFMDYQKVDSQHDFIEGKGTVVMNWILDREEQFELKNGGSATYPKGTWMVGIKVNDPKEWDKIKSGERTGFSIAGYWSAIEVKKHPSKGDQKEEDENDNDPDSKNQELNTDTEVNLMEKEEIQEIIHSELESFRKAQAEESSQKEALAKEEKLTSDLAEARKEIEELKKALESKEEEEEEPEDEKAEDDPEEEDEKMEEDDEEEKAEEDEEADGPEEEEKTFEDKQLESRGVLHRTTPGAPGKKGKSGDMGAKALVNGYKSHMTKGE